MTRSVVRKRGIRFGLAPDGVTRLSPPRPADYVATDSDRWGHAAPQLPSRWLNPVVTIDPDCLFLNVWAPVGAENLPVLVWVHGGGFVGGTAATPDLDGSRLAEAEQVVVVTVNYRLGYSGFGWFGDTISPDSSNLALQDLGAALRWVGAYIGDFGGDAGRVTVAAHSAGAFLASALPALDTSRGTFHGLALLSGGPWRVQTPRQASATIDQLIRVLELRDVRELLETDWRAIVAVQDRVLGDLRQSFSAATPGFAVVDDSRESRGVLSSHPADALSHAGVPVMLTATEDEVSGLRSAFPHVLTPEEERRLTEWGYHLGAARTAVALGERGWLGFIRHPSGESPHGMEVPGLFGGVTGAWSISLRRHLGAFVRDANPGWSAAGSPGNPVRILDGGEGEDRGRIGELLERWEGVVRP